MKTVLLGAVVLTAALGLVGYLLYRLMRWARSSSKGPRVLGAVLTEVTQSTAVYEAKQGKKREEGQDGGDPDDV